MQLTSHPVTSFCYNKAILSRQTAVDSKLFHYASITPPSQASRCPAFLEEDLLHGRNTLLAGSTIMSGKDRAVVFATGMNTEFGKIAHLTQAAGVRTSPLQQEIVRLSRIVALLVLSLGVVFFFIGQSMGLSFWENFFLPSAVDHYSNSGGGFGNRYVTRFGIGH